jgi:hypothetical protein
MGKRSPRFQPATFDVGGALPAGAERLAQVAAIGGVSMAVFVRLAAIEDAAEAIQRDQAEPMAPDANLSDALRCCRLRVTTLRPRSRAVAAISRSAP